MKFWLHPTILIWDYNLLFISLLDSLLDHFKILCAFVYVGLCFVRSSFCLRIFHWVIRTNCISAPISAENHEPSEWENSKLDNNLLVGLKVDAQPAHKSSSVFPSFTRWTHFPSKLFMVHWNKRKQSITRKQWTNLNWVYDDSEKTLHGCYWWIVSLFCNLLCRWTLFVLMKHQVNSYGKRAVSTLSN